MKGDSLTFLLDLLMVVNEFVAGGAPLVLLFSEQLIIYKLPTEEPYTKLLIKLYEVVSQVSEYTAALILQVYHQLSYRELQVTHHLANVRM